MNCKDEKYERAEWNKWSITEEKKLVQARQMGHTYNEIFNSKIFGNRTHRSIARKHDVTSIDKNIKYNVLNKKEIKKLDNPIVYIGQTGFTEDQDKRMMAVIRNEGTFRDLIYLQCDFFKDKQIKKLRNRFYHLKKIYMDNQIINKIKEKSK